MIINWKINSRSNQNWKELLNAGGGLLSYYGIHLLSLIIDCQYDLQDLQFSYTADFLCIRTTNSPSQLSIKISVANVAGFEMNLKGLTGSYHWSGASPFGMNPTKGIPDPRIPALVQYLSDWQTHKDLSESIAREHRILGLRQTISEIL